MTPEEEQTYRRLDTLREIESTQGWIDGWTKLKSYNRITWPAWCVAFAGVIVILYFDWINPDRWHPAPMVVLAFIFIMYSIAVLLAPIFYLFGRMGMKQNTAFIAAKREWLQLHYPHDETHGQT